jgi:hypothetical protein
MLLPANAQIPNRVIRQQLAVIVTHRSSIMYLEIHKIPIRSLVSVCVSGAIAVHELEDEGSYLLEPSRSSKYFQTRVLRPNSVKSGQNYFVARSLGSSLAIFQSRSRGSSITSYEGRPEARIEVVRIIDTGFSVISSATVLPNGLVVAGHKHDGKRHLLYYDFEGGS